jgi:hypothetical protein
MLQIDICSFAMLWQTLILTLLSVPVLSRDLFACNDGQRAGLQMLLYFSSENYVMLHRKVLSLNGSYQVQFHSKRTLD